MKRNIGISIIWLTITLGIAFIALFLIDSLAHSRIQINNRYPEYFLWHYELFSLVLIIGIGTLFILLALRLKVIYKWTIISIYSFSLLGILIGFLFPELAESIYHFHTIEKHFNWMLFFISLGIGGMISLIILGRFLIKQGDKENQ